MVIVLTKRIKFYIPIDQEKAKRIALSVTVSLAAMALILGVVCAFLFFQTDRLTVEAGETVSAEMLTGDADAYFGDDFDPECVNRAGVYYFTVYADGEVRKVRLEVIDTKAPEIRVKRINWPIGSTRRPLPKDFIDTVNEADDFKGYFVEELPKFEKNMGEYRAKVRFEDASGNKTEVIEVFLDLVSDNQPPRLSLNIDKLTVEVGNLPSEEAPLYDGIATVTDNCGGDLRIEIDDSGVDYNKEGRYSIYLVAYDMIGNRSEKISVIMEVVPKVADGEQE